MDDVGSSPTKKLSPNLDADDLDGSVHEMEMDPPIVEIEIEDFDLRGNETELETPSEAELERLSETSSEVSASSKDLEYFMQQFEGILSWIMKQESAFPFLKPFDDVASGQDDYNEVIRKPMDFGTILNRMESKEESNRYKNMNDICADVRLVFTNAMQYNAPGSNVHIMAQDLSSQFENMWYLLSLEVGDELMERCWELDEERQKEIKMSCCRNLTKEEKIMLSKNMCKLSAEDIYKALDIAAKYDPKLDVSSDVVDIDLDALDVIAQWMLYHFVEKCIREVGKGAAGTSGSASDGENMP